MAKVTRTIKVTRKPTSRVRRATRAAPRRTRVRLTTTRPLLADPKKAGITRDAFGRDTRITAEAFGYRGPVRQPRRVVQYMKVTPRRSDKARIGYSDSGVMFSPSQRLPMVQIDKNPVRKSSYKTYPTTQVKPMDWEAYKYFYAKQFGTKQNTKTRNKR